MFSFDRESAEHAIAFLTEAVSANELLEDILGEGIGLAACARAQDAVDALGDTARIILQTCVLPEELEEDIYSDDCCAENEGCDDCGTYDPVQD